MHCYGLLARSKLNYTINQSNNFYTQQQFNDDYFNPKAVLPFMREIALRVFDIINVDFQQVGIYGKTPAPKLLLTKLYQAPLSIGIPVPDDGSWNQTRVDWNGSNVPQHEVELYDYVEGDPYPYKIYDQYEPHLKELSANYYVPLVHQFVVSARNSVRASIPTTLTFNQKLWAELDRWFLTPFGRLFQ